MNTFTRTDEHHLEALREKNKHGPLEAEDMRLLDMLEKKYAAFIQESLYNMEKMAPNRNTDTAPNVLGTALWPILWFVFLFFFIMLLLFPSHLLIKATRLLVQWHEVLVGVFLFATTIVTFTRARSYPYVGNVLLIASITLSTTLFIATLLVLVLRAGSSEDHLGQYICTIALVMHVAIISVSSMLLRFHSLGRP
ncbi:hypothetical protein ERJ75_000332700 [Trypanosoma vivax]|uniref:Transmembrane protein n=1 Tax=Trypanosoma vivax (strain Y486) TaxID=1055687 RepID=G0UAK9_TRYVY|nr:hypothetical protein TRVL_04464 [Trypanosoma vivax]KAH8617913.1 hypothetical protein ERJ75_000332700 [Trypanosoma vivax]CCC52842.1 conserved hypothetical protein [Trypanosoma vivax Y486]